MIFLSVIFVRDKRDRALVPLILKRIKLAHFVSQTIFRFFSLKYFISIFTNFSSLVITAENLCEKVYNRSSIKKVRGLQ
ncbi:hypothetical protein CFK40_15755 [Virgibacillus necropolis]|uniref:Uncharacterized protein n=1 Tax=Virgibacillus necropolis TaxID=163877 RepID=A0A221MFF7_9BACI|nr:hypothetical protein CFK40_15755 [Virgibacillus necropolis]